MADLGLGGRREDRLGEAVGLPQTGRQRDAAHAPPWPGTPSTPSRRCSPRTTHSTGTMRTSAPGRRGRRARRPRTKGSGKSARSRSPAGGWGRRPRERSNQKFESWVRTMPLPGMPGVEHDVEGADAVARDDHQPPRIRPGRRRGPCRAWSNRPGKSGADGNGAGVATGLALLGLQHRVGLHRQAGLVRAMRCCAGRRPCGRRRR